VCFVFLNIGVITLVSIMKLMPPDSHTLCQRIAGGCDVVMGEFHTEIGKRYLPSPSRLTPPPGWSRKPLEDVKYFQERSGICHADGRFFNDAIYGNVTLRKERVRSMFAAWGTFADKHQLPYWIVHGSLIGYYFNKMLLPWDEDIDIQMSVQDLYALNRFNRTVIAGSYMIDVNPNIVYRNFMEMNVIDARVIDMKSGVFVDITAVAAVRNTIFGTPIYACKSPHFYLFTDLFPLYRTVFEGTPSWRPNAVVNILRQEYGMNVLTKFEVENHRWNGESWEPIPPNPS